MPHPNRPQKKQKQTIKEYIYNSIVLKEKPTETAVYTIATNDLTINATYLLVYRRTQNQKQPRYDLILKKELGSGSFKKGHQIVTTFFLQNNELKEKKQSRFRIGFIIKPKASSFIEDVETIEKETKMAQQVDLRCKTQVLNPEVIYMIATEAPGEDVKVIINRFLQRKNRGEKIKITEILPIIIAILRELERIHNKEVLHRDVKPENMIFDKKTLTLRLIDFGFSQHLNECQRDWGTPPYTAPEVFQPEKIGFAADLFSAIGVCYELLGAEIVNPKVPSLKILNKRRQAGYSQDLDNLWQGIDLMGVDENQLSSYLKEASLLEPKNRTKIAEVADYMENILQQLDKTMHEQQQRNFQRKWFYEDTTIKLRMALRRAIDILQLDIDTRQNKQDEKRQKLKKVRNDLIVELEKIDNLEVDKNSLDDVIAVIVGILNSDVTKKDLGEIRNDLAKILPDVFFSVPDSLIAYNSAAQCLERWEETSIRSPIFAK